MAWCAYLRESQLMMRTKLFRTRVSDHFTWFLMTPFLAVVQSRLTHVQRYHVAGCSSDLLFFFVSPQGRVDRHIAVFLLRFRSPRGVRGMRTIHCAMCVFNDQVGERSSCNSLTHRSCTDLGHDVLGVN